MERTLTPEEAQSLVDQRIDDFGLSSLPRVSVVANERGQWQIAWDAFQRVEAPMTAPQWCAWVEQHVGTLDPERLETLEG
jgi:hypothetical protein